MEDFIGLDLDDKFRDFFYCSIWDPALAPGSGPNQSVLFRMVYLARQNPKRGCAEFGDTMRWTLRQEAFECFQRLHGPRPIRFEHWFYAKLEQLVTILLYEELLVYGVGDSIGPEPPRTERLWEEGTGVLTGELPLIQQDDLEQAFSPRDSTEYDWAILVRAVLKAGEGRFAAFQRIIQERIAEREREASRDRRRLKNQRPDFPVVQNARVDPRSPIGISSSALVFSAA